MKSNNKKKILIAGGNGLIGQEIIKHGSKKFEFIIVDKIKKQKKNFIKCDINNYQSLKSLEKKLDKEKITLYAVINATHPTKLINKHFLNTNFKIFEKYILSHLRSYYIFTYYFFNYFKNRKIKNAKIINFSSIYGKYIPNFNIYTGTNIKSPIEYSISKSGINIMTKYFSRYAKFLKLQIYINCISPAGIYDKSKISNKFRKKYKKSYKSDMLKKSKVALYTYKLLSEKNKTSGKNIIITGGGKFN